jgi:hypothetical protein
MTFVNVVHSEVVRQLRQPAPLIFQVIDPMASTKGLIRMRQIISTHMGYSFQTSPQE